jgi:deoxyribodipyrimidine photolyase-like uncharacterized protein
MTTLRLILGDQLNPSHSWFATRDDDVVYVLMEIHPEMAYVLHHAQKILAIVAAMRAFAQQRKAGRAPGALHRAGRPSNRQSLTDNLDALVAHYGATLSNTRSPTNGGWTNNCAPGGRHADRASPCQAASAASTSTPSAVKPPPSSPAASNG